MLISLTLLPRRRWSGTNRLENTRAWLACRFAANPRIDLANSLAAHSSPRSESVLWQPPWQPSRWTPTDTSLQTIRSTHPIPTT